MSSKKKKKIDAIQWQTYLRILSYVRPYKIRLIFALLCGILFGSSLGGLLVAAQKILSKFDLEDVSNTVIISSTLIVVVFGTLRGIGQFFTEYLMAWVGYGVVRDIRREVFDHIQALSMGFFSKARVGEMISRTVNDTAMLEQSVTSELKDFVKQPFALLGALAVLIYVNVWLALATIVLFPICIFPISSFGRRVRKNAKAAQAHLSDLTSVLQEAVAGVSVVKAFGMEKFESDRFYNECNSLFKRMMRVAFSKSLIEPIITLMAIIAFIAALIFARKMGMNLSAVITFAVALVAMYEPVKKLSRIHLHINQATASGERIFEILDTEISVVERSDARPFEGDIEKVEFKDVSFSYEETPVLQNLDFTVQAGERVAVVGSSGSGKTTLLNLIPRFYDPVSGAILLNGVDIREFTLKSIRQKIGIVTQDTFLFNDSVANNIAYGQLDASREAIEEAAKRAYAHDFICQMENGYDTVIGDRGVRLSGGQCQRLAIARALLRNPPILILDEATSALDTESERLVQSAITELMKGRTVFAVAHRLSTIVRSDMIMVLDHGKVAESGTHELLLARDGLYKRLYDMQFSGV